MIGQARTGTGKTLAFGIALLQRIENGLRQPQALVVVPTRELAIQVHDDLVLAGGKLGTQVLAVYGGRAYEPQIDALKNGVDVIVGTPGRMLDLVKQKYLDLSQIKVLVLDEADRMLDLGFLPDIERIIGQVPKQRQTMLFSATMPGEIMNLSRRYLTQPTNVRAEAHAESEAQPKVVQYVWQAHQMDKPEVLARILQAEGRGLTMVFCQTKRACDRVATELAERGFSAAAVHGDLGQAQRERALRAFRAGKIDVLIATDVAARGLDVEDVTHVVNYECPEDDKAYVHRIGRTGRAGKEGISVTLVDWRDLQRWKLINKALGMEIPDPEETYSTSEHLFSVLNIPKGTTGTLPKANRERAGLATEALEDIGETGRQRAPKAPRVAEPVQERAPRTRSSRSRTRTRSGRTVEAVITEAPLTEAVSVEVPEVKAPRTRTRRTTKPADTTVAEPLTVEVPEAETPEVKAPRTRTRRTTTKPAEPTLTEAVSVEVPEVKAPRTRTRRTTKPADTTVAEPLTVEAPGAEVPVAKTTRTRTRKTAEPVVEAVTTEVPEVKTTRTRARKAAEPVDGTVAEVRVPRTRAVKSTAQEPPRAAGVPQVIFSAPEQVIATTLEEAPAAPARSRRSSRPAEASENS
jgi:superfamily II DNA/RNA helicase